MRGQSPNPVRCPRGKPLPARPKSKADGRSGEGVAKGLTLGMHGKKGALWQFPFGRLSGRAQTNCAESGRANP